MAARKKGKNPLSYWGVIAIAFALFGWFLPTLGPMWIMVAAGVSVLYISFQMPLPCGAWNRGGQTRCRNNASGFLPGCHLEQHRWQTAKLMVASGGWGEIREKTMASWKRALPALVAAATLVSGLAGAAQFTYAVVTG
ncbi:hypothetical protein [Nocardiopsis nanhaiensis]